MLALSTRTDARHDLIQSFGRFLEHCGKSSNPSKLEDFLRLLESFLAQLAAQGYTLDTRNDIHCGCFHFIVWLNQERIALFEIDDTVLGRFFRHDCICIAPGVIQWHLLVPESITAYELDLVIN